MVSSWLSYEFVTGWLILLTFALGMDDESTCNSKSTIFSSWKTKNSLEVMGEKLINHMDPLNIEANLK